MSFISHIGAALLLLVSSVLGIGSRTQFTPPPPIEPQASTTAQEPLSLSATSSVGSYKAFCYAQSEAESLMGGVNSLLPEVDIPTFVQIPDPRGAPSGYAKDKNHVYAGCDAIIPGADPASFVPLNDYSQDGSYAKDASHVWYITAPGGGEDASWSFSAVVISGADPATFSLVTNQPPNEPPIDAQDKNHLYANGQILQCTTTNGQIAQCTPE